jgi:hypothetical protein
MKPNREFAHLDEHGRRLLVGSRGTYPNRPSFVPPFEYPTWEFDQFFYLADGRGMAVYFDTNFGVVRRYKIYS